MKTPNSTSLVKCPLCGWYGILAEAARLKGTLKQAGIRKVWEYDYCCPFCFSDRIEYSEDGDSLLVSA